MESSFSSPAASLTECASGKRQVHQNERGLYLVEDVFANGDQTIPFQDLMCSTPLWVLSALRSSHYAQVGRRAKAATKGIANSIANSLVPGKIRDGGRCSLGNPIGSNTLEMTHQHDLRKKRQTVWHKWEAGRHYRGANSTKLWRQDPHAAPSKEVGDNQSLIMLSIVRKRRPLDTAMTLRFTRSAFEGRCLHEL